MSDRSAWRRAVLALGAAALVGLAAGLAALRGSLALASDLDGRSALGLFSSLPIALALAAVALRRAPSAALLVLPLPLLLGDFLAGRYLEVPLPWLADPAVEDRSGLVGRVLGAGVRFRIVGGAVSGAMFAALAFLRGRERDLGARLEALLAALGAALCTASAALAAWLLGLTEPDPSATVDHDPTGGLALLLHTEPSAVEQAIATARALELTHLGAAIALAALAALAAWRLRRDRAAALVAMLVLLLPVADVWADAALREATRARSQPWWWGTPGLEVPVSDESSGAYASAGATLLEGAEVFDAWGERRDPDALARLLADAAEANERIAEPAVGGEEEAPPDVGPPPPLSAGDRVVAVAVDERADASRWRALLDASRVSDVRMLCLAVRAADEDGAALAAPAPTGSPWIDALAPTHAAVLCVHTERALADDAGPPFFHVRLRGRAHPAVAAQVGSDPALPDAACPVGPDGDPLPRPPTPPLFAIVDDAMHTGDLITLAGESARIRLPVVLVAEAPAAIEAPLERAGPAPDLRGEHFLTEPSWARLHPGPDASPLASVSGAPPPPPLVADTEIFFEVSPRNTLAILALAVRRAAVARCYDEERARDPDARGALHLHVVTDLAGAPFDAACTRSAALSAELCRCLEEASLEGARPEGTPEPDATPVHLWFQPYHADLPE